MNGLDPELRAWMLLMNDWAAKHHAALDYMRDLMEEQASEVGAHADTLRSLNLPSPPPLPAVAA